MSSIVPPKVIDILKTVVNGAIENYEVSVQAPNKKGDGYLGQMFFISLREKNTGKQLNLVVKQAFSDNIIRNSQPIRDIFLNEIFFYTKLWPKFRNFQEIIPSKYHFAHLGKCWSASSEDNCERLVFENLKYHGFVVHDKKKALDREMFEMIFKIYGKFHAISFAYKALKPQEFSKVIEEVKDVWRTFSENKSFVDSVDIGLELALEDVQSELDVKILDKFKKYVVNGNEMFRKSLINGKYACIIHGDCWSNNMMFKYDDSRKLIDLRLIDFQLIRFGSPVCDLSYCLYSGGTKEIFDNLDRLLRIYHDSLSENLRAYGCDPEKIYPLKALKDDWKVHCHLGVIMGIILWRAKLTDDEDVLDLTDLSENGDDIKKFYEGKYDKKTFTDRTRDIILNLYENNCF